MAMIPKLSSREVMNWELEGSLCKYANYLRGIMLVVAMYLLSIILNDSCLICSISIVTVYVMSL